MKTFGKHSDCPISQQVLAYVEGALRPLARRRIARHCAACDFCGAEAQLLTKFTTSEENHTPSPTPALITVLGINKPVRRAPAFERRRAA